MTVIEGYVRFDTLGELPYDDMGYIRFDRNCTPGKTIPCGNACRTPANCKAKNKAGKGNKARVSEKGAELRQAFADKIRESRGMGSREMSNLASAYERQVYKKTPKKETLGMGPLAKSRAESKSRSAAAQKAAETRKAKKRAAEISTKRFGQATESEASLVDNFMATQAKKKARSASAQKAAETRRKKASS